MLSYLAGLDDVWGPFRLFGSITFRAMLAGFTALLLGYVLGPYVIGRLRRIKMSQTFRDHSEVGKLADLHGSKKDTPTMGGILIYIALVGSVVLWAKPNVYIWVALIVFTGLAIIGFWDDYLKVSKKSSAGLSSKGKLLAQGILTLLVVVLLEGNNSTQDSIRGLWVPFMKAPLIENMSLGLVFVFFFFVLSGSSNAINLTDGVDGLAIGCTVTVALAFMIMCYVTSNTVTADYLLINYLPGTEELVILCSALLGSSLAFLWFNSHPAEVFMGDTGSLALGGLIGTVAFMIQQPFTLVIIGGIFVMEAMSVILQVGSFKLTGNRIFKMAPIHHHFELKGWHESKVVIRFWILSLIFSIAGLATLKLR